MARPGRVRGDRFTSSEIAIAAGMSSRNFGLLIEKRVAPAPIDDGMGKAGHRSYDGPAVAQAALVGALHVAGFEMMVSARLAEAFAKDFEENYGSLPSNLRIFLQSPLNPTPGHTPWKDEPGEERVDIDLDYWLHERLRNRTSIYQRDMAQNGDMMIEIADGTLVLTHVRGAENVKTFSPVTRGGLPASPDYRIVGQGNAVHIVPVHEELESLNFSENPAAAERLRHIEREYIEGRKHAVVVAKINVSLAIRNAFDCIQDDREGRAAVWPHASGNSSRA